MSQLSPTALSTCVREVAAFVDAAGWDQPVQLFALVPTEDLAAQEPELADQLDLTSELTPVAQDALTGPDGSDGAEQLDTALASILWPTGVSGCVLVQEVLILPPEAEAGLEEVAASTPGLARTHAGEHPDRTEARLVAAVLRTGQSLCLLQVRATAGPQTEAPELLEHPGLAPNLVAALHATFED